MAALTPDLTVYYRDIVNSIEDALVVLDSDLTIQYANLPFYRLFGGREADTIGQPFFGVDDAVWDIPSVRPLLEAVLPHKVAINDFTLEQEFPVTGRRILNLSARELVRDGLPVGQMLVTISDVTAEEIESEQKDKAIDRTNAMMTEVHHRVKNNLASVLSMIRIEHRMLQGEDGRAALERIAMRIESMAALYELLAVDENTGTIKLLTYLNAVCRSIERVATASRHDWQVKLSGDDPAVDTDQAIALGAIVNELVANAAKYAFLDIDGPGVITVECRAGREHLTLDVGDNGTGFDPTSAQPRSTGLGMKLVDAYLSNLRGTMERTSGPAGTHYAMTVPLAPDSDVAAAGGVARPSAADDAAERPAAAKADNVVQMLPKAG